MNLVEKLKKETIFIADGYPDTDSFYADYADFLKSQEIIENSDIVKRLFIKREKVHSTSIKKGAAAPHIFSDQFGEFIFSLALIKNGMDFKAPGDGDVYLIFILMSADRDVALHLKALAHIARLVQNTNIVELAKECRSADELFELFTNIEKNNR